MKTIKTQMCKAQAVEPIQPVARAGKLAFVAALSLSPAFNPIKPCWGLDCDHTNGNGLARSLAHLFFLLVQFHMLLMSR